MPNPKKRSWLASLGHLFSYPDRSGVIPTFATLTEKSTQRIEEKLSLALVHKLRSRVIPATQYAQETKIRWETAEETYNAHYHELCGLIGLTREWDLPLALLLAGWPLWWRFICLSLLSGLLQPMLIGQTKARKQVHSKKDYSTLLSILLSIPMGYAWCRQTGINPRHGLSLSELVVLAVFAGIAIALNIASKDFISSLVQDTRKAHIKEGGAIHIDYFPYGIEDWVLWLSISLVLGEMLISASGALSSLPLTLAKNPLCQVGAVLSGGLGGLGNQFLAWSIGRANIRRELRELKLDTTETTLQESRTKIAARAFQIKKILPSLKQEVKTRKRLYQQAHCNAWRVYRSWAQQARFFLEEVAGQEHR